MSIANVAAQAKQVVEAGSPYVAGGAFLGWAVGVLPSVAALFSVLWLAMQMVMNWKRFVAEVKSIVNRKGKSEQ